MEDIPIIRDSIKVIRASLEEGVNIVSYLRQETSLRNSIERNFPSVSPRLKCRIALQHCNGMIESDAWEVFLDMDKKNDFDLALFFSNLLQKTFPAATSSLSLVYDSFVQGDLTIVRYGNDFLFLCELMELNPVFQKFKFIEGLKDRSVRETLLKADLTRYDVRGLITYAESLSHSLSLLHDVSVGALSEGIVTQRVLEERNVSQGEIKVSSKYFKLARDKGLRK